MSDKKKNVITFCILFILIILLAVIIYIDSEDSDKLFDDVLLMNETTGNDVKDNITEENNVSEDTSDDYEVVNTENISIDEYVNDSLVEEVFDDINNNNSDTDSEDVYNEEDIVSYFRTMENEIEESSSFKEKFKEYFVNIVDFIFYNGEVNGYTFDELSGTTKAKIISIALKIDSMIEEYMPNYKENIFGTSSKVYNNVKEKLVILYMEISTDICENNEEDCLKVKDIFTDIKNTCKIGWEFIKSLFGNGFLKIKEWYEIYSGK